MILADFRKCYIPCGQKVVKNSTFTKCTAQMIAIVALKTLYKFGPSEKQSKTMLIWLRMVYGVKVAYRGYS